MHVAILDTFLAFQAGIDAAQGSEVVSAPRLGQQLGSQVASDGPDLLRYVLVCGFLILLIAALGWGFRRVVAGGMRARAGRRALQTIDVLPLGGKAKVAVVRCYDKSYLIGIGDKEIRLLDVLDAEATETDEAPELTVLQAAAAKAPRRKAEPAGAAAASVNEPKVARKAGNFLQALKSRVGDDAAPPRRKSATKKQPAGASDRGLPGGGILG